jgi:hypothetical protein
VRIGIASADRELRVRAWKSIIVLMEATDRAAAHELTGIWLAS